MAENDRISELPESLITQILSYLPTKDSVKTSVLSSRWKNLWLKVPGLDLDFYHFRIGHRLVSFVDRFLEFNPELRLQKLKVKCKYLEEIEWLKECTDAAINRGVQHLDVKSRTCYDDGDLYPLDGFMPLNLYTSKTLVSLKLSFSGIDDPEFVYMPCLKSMHLVEFQRRTNLEKLFLGCPVLEELILVRSLADEFPVTCVRSRSLKRFCVPFQYGRYCKSRVESTLEIDAPGLEYMSLEEDQFDRYVVKDLTSLFTVDLDINFLGMFNKFLDKSKRKGIGDFLTGISSVRHMTISQKTVEALKLYSKRGLIPKFNNLSRLQAEFPCDLLQFLPAFLESFPNLKHLILKLVYYSEEMKVFKLIDVPRCFLSTLECVEIKGICEWEEEETQIARYFLENSAVLKKLVVSRVDDPRRVLDSEIYEELNKLAKRSPSCQITIDCDCNLLCNHK